MKTEEEYEEEKEIDNILNEGHKNIGARVPFPTPSNPPPTPPTPPNSPPFSMLQSPVDALRSKVKAIKDTGVYNISIDGVATSTGKVRGSLVLICKYCLASKDGNVIPGITDISVCIDNFTHNNDCLVKKLEDI